MEDTHLDLEAPEATSEAEETQEPREVSTSLIKRYGEGEDLPLRVFLLAQRAAMSLRDSTYVKASNEYFTVEIISRNKQYISRKKIALGESIVP
ncbi:MAG: hypothetical protein NZ992_00005, partial [Candidatus Korarchaeum sp.]|nr:hypothetical protein [Candidatus Korarchaeum sp.]